METVFAISSRTSSRWRWRNRYHRLEGAFRHTQAHGGLGVGEGVLLARLKRLQHLVRLRFAGGDKFRPQSAERLFKDRLRPAAFKTTFPG